MNKRKIGLIAPILAIIFIAATLIIYWFLHFSPVKNPVNTGRTNQLKQIEINEPNISFTPTYQEERVPLAKIANYSAFKTKYGLNLSPSQEKYLNDNRFLLIDFDQVPFLKSGINFDQWLASYDSLGGGSIYDRKPEDALLISPDIVLHAYHKYFELTLEQLEQNELNQALGEFLSGLHGNLISAVANSQGEVKKRYQNLEAQIVLAQVLYENKNVAKPSYFSNPEEEQKYNEQDKNIDSLENAERILAKYSKDLPTELVAGIKADLSGIYEAKEIGASPLFKQYDEQIKTDYTQFTPRSHYTKNSVLRSYFRTMMYLGRSSYLLKSDLGIADTNLLVKQMNVKKGNAPAPLESWERITAVTSFYAGQSDDLSYKEWREFETSILGPDVSSDEVLISSENIKKLAQNVDKLRMPKILSDVIIDENIASLTKADLLRQSLAFRIFGQKFSFDAWILNDLTAGQEKTEVRLPSTPSALFIPAAFNDGQALNYVKQFLASDSGFSANEVNGFLTKSEQKKNDILKVKESEWLGSLGSAWLYVLGSLTHNYGPHYPLYMQASSFLDKQIQTFLGSYAELKHDTLLYAKQSYAELGAGGDERPIPPVVKSFVEPNLEFWTKFNSLLSRTDELYKDNNLFKDNTAYDRLRQFKNMSLLFAKIAEKELRSESITDDEYETLRTTKFSFMAQPFTPVDPDEDSGKTALIADIHTDMLRSQILYEATAKPYFMIALVGNEQSPRVVAGLVYDHYELTDKIGKRLTDEDWKNRVYKDNSLLPVKNFWYQSLLMK
ncbi:MAG: DUF3160 domain-containing protein [Candidatus Falkowbacteria bacterium]|nr:DUF3160 domain-containing protein [Candidatus Falkowbacteria bacterium]